MVWGRSRLGRGRQQTTGDAGRSIPCSSGRWTASFTCVLLAVRVSAVLIGGPETDISDDFVVRHSLGVSIHELDIDLLVVALLAVYDCFGGAYCSTVRAGFTSSPAP